MATERTRAKGEPRYPIGIRKRQARAKKSSSTPGINHGRAPFFSVRCSAPGCPSKGAEVRCSIRGLRECPSCGRPFCKMGWPRMLAPQSAPQSTTGDKNA